MKLMWQLYKGNADFSIWLSYPKVEEAVWAPVVREMWRSLRVHAVPADRGGPR